MSVGSGTVTEQVPRRPRELTGDDGEAPARVTILYPTAVLKRVQEIARHQGVAFTTLLRQWTIQRLNEEERREREQQQ